MSADATPFNSTPALELRHTPTIYDIARLAEVSPSAVSRALSKPGRLNAKTEARIRLAAKELNYRTNPMARALPTGRTNMLGLLVADITNPMFFDVVRGAEQAAAERGYTLVLAESRESAEREAETAERVMASVDGLILVATRLSDSEIHDYSMRKPLVVINRDVADVTSVVPDLEPGVDQALRHLHELGHASLAYLSGPATSWMNAARRQMIFDKAPALGMTTIEIGPGAPTLDGGRDAFERVRAAGVTAVIAYNDLMAIGLMRAAEADGVTCPAEFSLIGFDDIFGSDFTSPTLTTIRTPLGILGSRAVDQVLGELVQPGDGAVESLPASVIVTDLIIRCSTGPRLNRN